MALALNRTTLADLPDAVAVPRHDPASASAGIVHVGVGGFHRSHLAVYVDDLLAAGHRDWAIRGVGLLPGDRALHDALAAQDHLYSVVTLPGAGDPSVRVIASIVDHLLGDDDPDAVVEALADPAVRIVSLTVTESGYLQRPDGTFDADSPALRADLAGPATPRSAFGVIVTALKRRRERDHGPFTVMSCDNLPGNGTIARAAVLGTAALTDPELHDWIDEHVTFPQSMVDRITPATTPQLIEALERDHGLRDRWPVPAEPFRQWVLEDSFAAGRPPFEDVGAHLVPDVRPYEEMKLRLLNGAHQVIAHLGRRTGHTFVHEAIADLTVAEAVRTYLHDEAAPTLDPVPGIDVGAYIATVLERFANPRVADTLDRLLVDTQARLRQFVVPIVRDRDSRGVDSPVARRVLELAGLE